MSRSLYIRNRFAWRSYNGHRVKRALEVSPEHGVIALDVIPFLLDRNHPKLPGYIKGEPTTRGAVALYNPSDTALRNIRRVLPVVDSADIEASAAPAGSVIDSIFMMGSIGTVAQTKSSDYDYWIIIDESGWTQDALTTLKARLTAIEQWARERRMETHFFLLDAEKTRCNDFGAVDKESAGSSQKQTLKEEFYRTAMLVAGKDPLWWLFPACLNDKQYDEMKSDLLDEGAIDETEVVDLGNVASVSTGELFGALLWQFNKAMSNPYKAAMKMALLKSYIDSGQEACLLCDVLKGAIQHNPDKTDLADPYLMMFDHVRRHYIKAGMKKAAACLEKCFYLKSMGNPLEGLDDDRNLPYKERTLRAALRHWKWDKEKLRETGDFRQWEYSKAAGLGAQIHTFMLETYKELTDGIKDQKDVKSFITDRDLTVLGRKLFAIYDRKNPAKTERVKRVMNEIKGLDAITFRVCGVDGQKTLTWEMYMRDIRSDLARSASVSESLLKKGKDPVALMMWLSVNEIYSPGSSLYFLPDKRLSLALKDLQGLMRRIHMFFPAISMADIDSEDLLHHARVKRMLVALNFLSPPWKTDIETMHIVYSTSWGESFCQAFDARTGARKLLVTLARTSEEFSLSDPAFFDIYANKNENDSKLIRQLKSYLSKKFKMTVNESSS